MITLTLKKKLLALQTLALIPWFLGLGYLAWHKWPEFRVLGREREEIKRFSGYIRLADLLQRHRGLSFLYLNLKDPGPKKPLASRILALEDAFYKSIAELQKMLLPEHEAELKSLQELRESFKALRLNKFRGDPWENFWAHTHLIEGLLSLIESADHRHVIFSDPDIYVRTLADIALIELPRLIEILGRIRGLGSGYLAQRETGPAERRIMLKLYTAAHAHARALEWTAKSIRFPENILSSLRRASRELEDFLQLSEEVIATGHSRSLTPQGYFHIASSTIKTFLNISREMTEELSRRLEAKKRRLVRNWFFSTSILFLVSIFFCLSFYLTYRGVVRKLTLITQGAQRIARGDLSTRIELDSKDEIGQLARVLNQSVEKLRKNLEEIYFLHYHDRLTRLPNRDKLLEDLSRAGAPALLLLDINNFKDLNFVWGEERGDQILRKLAERLKEIFPYEVYRVGPDEFAVMADLSREGLSREDFFSLCEEGFARLEDHPLRWNGEKIHLSFFGAAVSDSGYSERLLILAYDALKEAKEARHKFVRVSSPPERRRSLYEERMLLVRKIREALHEDRIVPFYQPILNNHTGRVEKFEALVRMIDEDGTVIPPGKFLEISQRMGYYPQITRRVVEKTLFDFRDLPFEISINLSLEDFESEEIKKFLLSYIEGGSGVEPSRLVFEVLETESIPDYQIFMEFLKRLKERGCRLAIDDFGTGYSNLERLLELGVDFLKIDASIIRRLPEDETARVLTEAIVTFSRKVGIKTIAEFVSEERIFRLVKELGIDYSQGYFIGQPEPIEAIRDKYL